eukprot:6191124-Pleurochrysis_carterae.AAC.1
MSTQLLPRSARIFCHSVRGPAAMRTSAPQPFPCPLPSQEPPPPPPLEEDEPPPPPDDDMEDADDSVLAGSRWAANDDDEDMSLRETLDRLAASHDLIFMSTADRHDGRQIFLFGKVRVLLDPAKHLVYAKLDKRGFAPTSLAQLVKEAQARSG